VGFFFSYLTICESFFTGIRSVNKLLFCIAAGTALALSAWVFYQSETPALQVQLEPSPVQNVVAPIEQDEGLSEQDAIESQINLPATAENVQHQPQPKSTPESMPVNEDEVEPAPVPDGDQDQVTPNPAFARNEQQFWEEKADKVWAPESSQGIADFFEQNSQEESFGSKLSDVECRATLCRVQVVHNDLRAEQEFVMKFASGMSDQDIKSINFQSEKGPDGRIVEVMYMSK